MQDVSTMEARVENGVLHCQLPANVSSDTVSWTLHRGDFDPKRSSRPAVSGSRWRVRLPDRTSGYAVRAVVDGVTYQSEWFQHFSSDAVRRYRAWREQWSPETSEPAPIGAFAYEHPFQNIAFVIGETPGERADLDQLASTIGLVIEREQGVLDTELVIMSGLGAATDQRGSRFVFSGISRNADRLLLGQADVERVVPAIDGVRDQIGEYHLLSWDATSISFEHDYIGQGHLFYYDGDGFIAAANGLHLLALTLKAVGVELEIDAPAAKAKFFSTSYPFEHQYGCQTDFVGVRRVSVYDRLFITAEGPRLTKTELWQDTQDGDLSDGQYDALLYEAASEVVDNVRIALQDERFENVVVELSAGLDSRIVYSALTRLPPDPKVRIATRRGGEERVAAQINNLYGYAWDDLPRVRSFTMAENSKLPATSHSVFMDGYYIEAMFKARESYAAPTLLLTGHGGEAFSRVMSVEGYFARDFNGELPADAAGFQHIYDNVIRYIGNHQVWFDAGRDHFPDILRESLAQSPSAFFAKAFADLYVSERNPFIGGSVFRGAMSAPQWRPLHSKSLYRLRSLWFQHRQDYRLQFDLIRALNPLVSEAPYQKPLEVERKREFETYRQPFRLRSSIEFDDDATLVSEARARSAARSKWLPNRETFDRTRSSIRDFEESSESFLEPLGHILTRVPELEDMGLPLFTYIERVINRDDPKSFSKRHNVRNKLHILLQEVLLTGKPITVEHRAAREPRFFGLFRRKEAKQ